MKTIFSFLVKVAAAIAATALMLAIGDVLSQKLAKKDHNIKIIGGSDGPTAIFITSRANSGAFFNLWTKLCGKIMGLLCPLS